MINSFKALLFVLLIGSLSSCISYKKVPYFKDLDSNQANIAISQYQTPMIQKGDILGIYIHSRSETTVALFGTPTTEVEIAQSGSGKGFLVQDDGTISINTIGQIKAEGLTELQLQEIIAQKAAIYVKEPAVGVRVTNFKVTVNGEVNKPGVYQVSNGRINALEAITLAGDLKITAKRSNVLVMRIENNKMTTTRLNLNSKDVFVSSYFHLKNNDMIYVEPNVQRLQREDNVYRNISTVISVISILSLLLYRLHN